MLGVGHSIYKSVDDAFDCLWVIWRPSGTVDLLGWKDFLE